MRGRRRGRREAEKKLDQLSQSVNRSLTSWQLRLLWLTKKSDRLVEKLGERPWPVSWIKPAETERKGNRPVSSDWGAETNKIEVKDAGAGKTDKLEISVKMKSQVGEERWGKRA